MDIVLFVILAFYFVKGCLRGFLSMLFSLFELFFVAVISWKLTEFFLPTAQSVFGGAIFDTTKSLFDGIFPGTFSNLSDFNGALSQSSAGAIFGLFISKLLSNISFDGTLSAGQILAPTISKILVAILTFAANFLILEIFLKFFRYFLRKIINKSGLSSADRVFGGALGLLKGLTVFGLVFGVLSIAANMFLNEGLLSFVSGGTISNFLYNNLIGKFLNYVV